MTWTAEASYATGQEKVSDTGLLLYSPAAALNVGDVIIVVISSDNVQTTDGESSLISSVVGSYSGTFAKALEYTNGEGAVASGVTCSVWYKRLTAEIAGSTDTITITWASAVTAKAAGAHVFHTTGASVSVAAALGSVSDADPASMTISGLANREYLFYRAVATERGNYGFGASTNYTAVSINTTTDPGDDTDVACAGEYRILTGTGDTTDPTTGAQSASVYVAFSDISAYTLSADTGAYALNGNAVTFRRDYTLPAGAITATSITTGGGGGATSFNTASVSPAANKVHLLAVSQDISSITPGGPPLPTVTGCNLTWVEVGSRVYWPDTGGYWGRINLFRACGPSPTTGALTIAVSQQADGLNWSLVALDGVDTGGTHGSNAIVQATSGATDSGTSLSVSLAAFANASNGTFGAFAANKGGGLAPAVTHGTGFTEIHDTLTGTNYSRVQTQYRADNDTSVDISAGESLFLAGVAVELKAAAFILTANTVALRKDSVLSGGLGSFALTGYESFARRAPAATFTATPGVFSLTGTSATFTRGRHLPATTGGFALSGIAATLVYARRLKFAVTTGTFAVTGLTATFVHIKHRKLIAERGQFWLGAPDTFLYSPGLAAPASPSGGGSVGYKYVPITYPPDATLQQALDWTWQELEKASIVINNLSDGHRARKIDGS